MSLIMMGKEQWGTFLSFQTSVAGPIQVGIVVHERGISPFLTVYFTLFNGLLYFFYIFCFCPSTCAGGVIPWSNPLWPLWSFNIYLRFINFTFSQLVGLSPQLGRVTGPSLLMGALATSYLYGSGHRNHLTAHRVPPYSLFRVFLHTGDISGLPPQICVLWPEAAAVTSVPWHRGKESCVFVPRGFTSTPATRPVRWWTTVAVT